MARELTAQDILKLRKPDERYVKFKLGNIDKGYYYEEDNKMFIDEPTTYEYTVYTDKNEKLENVISDKEGFENAIKEANDFDLFDDMTEEQKLEMTTDMTYEKFFSKDFMIEVTGDIDDIIYFINNNNLDDKKVIICKESTEPINIEEEEYINYIINNLKNSNNIYAHCDGNQELVRIVDYKNTIEYINNIVEKTKRLNLSPIEKLMYVYDVVRDRKYNMESEDEEYSVSRDLTSVTSGEKIVCVGFAEIFDKVVQKLGFNSMVHTIKPQNEDLHGHARNMVYVKDRKYNIDGVYFFDTTFDSKKKDDNSHFNSYKFFAKTDMDFYRLDHMTNRLMINLSKVCSKIIRRQEDTIIRTEINSVDTLYKNMYKSSLLGPMDFLAYKDEDDEEMPEMFISMIGNIDKNEIHKKAKKFIDKFHKPLSLEQFMKILTNVRIQEYYENSDKFPLSTKKILEITSNSVKVPSGPELRMLNAIFGDRVGTPDTVIENEGLDKDINRVRVAKTLRKVLENKANRRNS